MHKVRWLRTKIEMQLKWFNADKTTIHSLSLLDTPGKTKTMLNILYKLYEHFDKYVAFIFIPQIFFYTLSLREGMKLLCFVVRQSKG